MIGAMISAFLVWLFYKDHFKITEDEGGKLACFSTGRAIRNTFSNFISELIGTFVLVFTVFYIAGSIFSTEVTGDAKIGLGTIGALPVSIIVLGNWFSIRWDYWICNKPCKRFSIELCILFLPVKGRQRLGICMDSCYCTINRRSISSTTLPCITIIFIQLY